MADTAAVTALLTPRQALVATAAVESVGQAGVLNRDGRALVHLSLTHRLRLYRSRRYARLLNKKWQRGRTSEIVSSATLGMTGLDQLRPYAICSRQLAYEFGSAKRTLALACR